MPKQATRILDEIHEVLKSLDRKLDKLLERMGPSELSGQVDPPPLAVYDGTHAFMTSPRQSENTSELRTDHWRFVPGAFGSLPEHLRGSMEAITTFGEATALEVGETTGKSRAAESDYLNQLVDRGFLRKERRGKEIVFEIFSLHRLCPMCGLVCL